jgi:hypothetical protein
LKISEVTPRKIGLLSSLPPITLKFIKRKVGLSHYASKIPVEVSSSYKFPMQVGAVESSQFRFEIY